MHDIHQLLRSHRSIRKFTGDELDHETVGDIVRSGLSAGPAMACSPIARIRITRRNTVRSETTQSR